MNQKSVILSGFFLMAFSLFTISSCTQGSTVDDSGDTTVAFTNATMKPWFDTHCSSCHASGGVNARDWTYNPSNEKSVQSYISDIYKEVYVRKSMPPGGISTAELNKFKAWYDAGHPSN